MCVFPPIFLEPMLRWFVQEADDVDVCCNCMCAHLRFAIYQVLSRIIGQRKALPELGNELNG